MGTLGVQEMVVIFLVALILFGPKKLPELGRTIGKAITEFRRASNDLKATFEREMHTLERESESLKEVTQKASAEIHSQTADIHSQTNYEYPYYDSGAYGSEPYDSTPHDSSTVSATEVAGAETPGTQAAPHVEGTVARGEAPHASGTETAVAAEPHPEAQTSQKS